MSKDAVVAFTYSLHSTDQCTQKRVYSVDGEAVSSPRVGAWEPMTPGGSVASAELRTHFKSGKTLDIELDGDDHLTLAEDGRFEKLLRSIARGNMPGEALKRQLTKALDLPKLPKVKRARMK